jgi:hypothetical protein
MIEYRERLTHFDF